MDLKHILLTFVRSQGTRIAVCHQEAQMCRIRFGGDPTRDDRPQSSVERIQSRPIAQAGSQIDARISAQPHGRRRLPSTAAVRTRAATEGDPSTSCSVARNSSRARRSNRSSHLECPDRAVRSPLSVFRVASTRRNTPEASASVNTAVVVTDRHSSACEQLLWPRAVSRLLESRFDHRHVQHAPSRSSVVRPHRTTHRRRRTDRRRVNYALLGTPVVPIELPLFHGRSSRSARGQ